MAKNTTPKIPSSEITPEELFFNRRQFMKLAAMVGAGALLSACNVQSPSTTASETAEPSNAGLKDEEGSPVNTYHDITNFNNYFEFSTNKGGIGELSKDFPTSPWQVEVSGLVQNPRTYDINDLRKFPIEERIYRLRCVEAWSMVIPWNGFPLNLLLKEVDPMTSAKYVHFTTKVDKEHMPGVSSPYYPWPYTEGLRLDEAYHDLTLMATGLYGKDLPTQDGAPIRLVVPWKYGFKSCKAIIKIELTEEMPKTFWSTIAPREYGFYSNVNPNVPHPRWSQADERRIGVTNRIPTELFNGYADQVGQLYSDMNLQSNF